MDNYLSLKGRGLTKRKKNKFFPLKVEANKAELFNYLIINYSVKKNFTRISDSTGVDIYLKMIIFPYLISKNILN